MDARKVSLPQRQLSELRPEEVFARSGKCARSTSP